MYNDLIADRDFSRVVSRYKPGTIFETGTAMGGGAKYFSKHAQTVVSIEVERSRWEDAGERLRSMPNSWCCMQEGGKSFHIQGRDIFLFLGSSPRILSDLIKYDCFAKPYLFFLDAHGSMSDYWPLLDEMKVIAGAKLGMFPVVIHDIKVPGKDFLYDSYNGQDLTFDYVKDGLREINPNFTLRFNDECKMVNGMLPRGILYALP